MSKSIDWDVDGYRTEHECDEHWELRKNFMDAHKHDFSEDRLVCLAQVFTNVEFLGCRYPEKTMQLVAQLSHEVAKDYREKQKSKLKRTFVKASDAAGAKAKVFRSNNSLPIQINQPAMQSQNPNKRRNLKSSFKVGTQPCLQTNLITIPSLRQYLNPMSPWSNFVLFCRPDNTLLSNLRSSASRSKMEFQCKFERHSEELNDKSGECSLFINNKFIASGIGEKKAVAANIASEIAIKELQKDCFSIKVLNKYISEKTISKEGNMEPVQNIMEVNSIGNKIMKMMGWSGGGLGKDQQGIITPIMLTPQMARSGIGLDCSDAKFAAKINSIFNSYLRGNMGVHDLKFSNEFTNVERKTLHMVALKCGLLSKSYGKLEDRFTVISRKENPWEIVEQLLKGGPSDKYELVLPTNAPSH